MAPDGIRKFNVIVAACANGGIGLNGGMPWNLKGDMKQFARLTTLTQDPLKKNAVIMGRKTWFAIPEKHRPLKNRINVVISGTLSGLAPPTYQAGSIEEALTLLTVAPLRDEVENVWIIGGQSLYQHAMASSSLGKVYFTRILREFECDAFFPVAALEKMEKTEEDVGLPAGEQEDNGVPYRFEVYSAVEGLN
ncbi:putative Dihydrofolate reductase [Hypsibius exemplaris]|uniref:dihydrofolate reductase n=1 Tax=Hypsibius exemplaris TaxID=2072580 RepID=A0A9X6NIC3_HYPEX|nr:putative Dihydrofolate reductase [Hypsibius exemplaris]